MSGFASRTKPGVELRAGELFILDQQLGLASLAETVQVVAEAPEPPPAPAATSATAAPAARRCGWRRRGSRKPVPVPAEVLASVCGPGQPGDASLTIGHLVAHRDEPGRRLYGRGDVLVLDVGADLGLETGQNLVVRRRFLPASAASRRPSRRSASRRPASSRSWKPASRTRWRSSSTPAANSLPATR